MYRFHLYWDTRHRPPGGFFDVSGIKILVAVSVFGEEIYQAPKTWADGLTGPWVVAEFEHEGKRSFVLKRRGVRFATNFSIAAC